MCVTFTIYAKKNYMNKCDRYSFAIISESIILCFCNVSICDICFTCKYLSNLNQVFFSNMHRTIVLAWSPEILCISFEYHSTTIESLCKCNQIHQQRHFHFIRTNCSCTFPMQQLYRVFWKEYAHKQKLIIYKFHRNHIFGEKIIYWAALAHTSS